MPKQHWEGQISVKNISRVTRSLVWKDSGQLKEVLSVPWNKELPEKPTPQQFLDALKANSPDEYQVLIHRIEDRFRIDNPLQQNLDEYTISYLERSIWPCWFSWKKKDMEWLWSDENKNGLYNELYIDSKGEVITCNLVWDNLTDRDDTEFLWYGILN